LNIDEAHGKGSDKKLDPLKWGKMWRERCMLYGRRMPDLDAEEASLVYKMKNKKEEFIDHWAPVLGSTPGWPSSRVMSSCGSKINAPSHMSRAKANIPGQTVGKQ
jgi:hypothetical protein